MAGLVSIDYNPLRRATSSRTEARLMQYTAKGIGLTGEGIGLAKKGWELQERQVEEQEKGDTASKVWKTIAGGLKIIGAAALAIGTGFTATIPAIGLGLSGAADITDAWTGHGSELQGAIGSLTNIGQQVYDYHKTNAENDIASTINKHIALDQANGVGRFYLDGSEIKYLGSMDTQTAINEMNKKYGGKMHLGDAPGTTAMEQYITNNQFGAAQQINARMKAAQQQLINDSMNEAISGNLSFEQVANTINGLGMAPSDKRQALNTAANTVQYFATDKNVQQMIQRGAAMKDVEAYIDAGGDRSISAAAKEGARPLTREEYIKQGFSGEQADSLIQTNAQKYEDAVNARAASYSGDTSPQQKRRRAEKELDEENPEVYLDHTEKGALKESAARHLAAYAKQKGEEAGAQFDVVEGKAASIAAAVSATKDMAAGQHEPIVKGQIEKIGMQRQVKALDGNFTIEFEQADTLAELEAIREKYNPENNKAEYKAAYAGQEPLMWTHYGKIRDEIDRRVKTLESASDKYGKEAARQMQDTVYAAFAQWQLGGMDGGAVLNSLHAAASMGVIPPEKYVNMLNDVTFGNDSTPDNPATKELYKQAQKMFDDIGVDADRQYELLESLRNMRTAGKSQEEIREQINTFRDTETAGFLTRALSSIGAGQGVREADVKDIIKYGAAGRLDNYFVQRYTTNAYMDADGGLVSGKERMIVGDDERMTAIMQAAGAEALSQISRITGVPESRITGREAAGSDGDKKGSFEYNVDGAPMRLNVDDKNRYFVEKREGGKWTPYTTAKKGVPPWSAYGSNGAGSPYNPYNNNAGGSP